jgi:FkbM family methyltransferase
MSQALTLLLKRFQKSLLILGSKRQIAALLSQRVLAANEHRRVIRPDIRTVVDIGANRGQFALAARARLPEAQIYSFEPLAGPADVFRSTFAGDALTRLFTCAIGASHEFRQMNVAAHDDSSSFLPTSHLQEQSNPGSQTISRSQVEVMPLDRALAGVSLEGPSFLKIDVQGAEQETLIGCESLLTQFSYVYCECAFVELYRGQKLSSSIIAWLLERHFSLIGVYNVDYDDRGMPLQADFLFQKTAPTA